MLKDDIIAIREGIRVGRFTNEASVCQGIVLRILHALGWPTYDTQVVSPEYSVEGRRVDFGLCHPPSKPVVFVEVKQIGRADSDGERQLFEYAFHRGVPVAVLTDGQDWQFFLPAEQGDYGERRVYKLDIVERDVDEVVYRLERYLQYDRICSGEAIEDARADYKDVARRRLIGYSLPEAWLKLVEEEDESLIELMSDRVENLCGYKPDPDTVAAFLRASVHLRHEPQEDYGQKNPIKVDSNVLPPVPPHGVTGFRLRGQFHQARNAKDVLIRAFRELAAQDTAFLERFVSLPRHGRTRRYLARSKEDLYPGRPDLARDYSEEIGQGYWLGTNNCCNAIARILEMACQVAGLKYGTDFVATL